MTDVNAATPASFGIRKRRTTASTAPMPDARPRRRGQAPQPRSGAPKAQGLTAATVVAAPSRAPSIALHDAPTRATAVNPTGTDTPMETSSTPPIYTSLTDATLADFVVRQ